MSTFKLEINTDNASFTDDRAAEVARILRESADRIEMTGDVGSHSRFVGDLNGNTVGKYEFASDESKS